MAPSPKESGRSVLERFSPEIYPLLVRHVERLIHKRGLRNIWNLTAIDVAQEAFIKGLQNNGRFRGRTSGEVYRWLEGIAQNVIRNLTRVNGSIKRDDRSVDSSYVGNAELLAEISAKQAEPEAELIAVEKEQAIFYALSQLPRVQFKIFWLRSVEGLPVKEVAKRLGKSPSTVSKTLQRARARLRSILRSLPDFEEEFK